jgi:hypothetical protein
VRAAAELRARVETKLSRIEDEPLCLG